MSLKMRNYWMCCFVSFTFELSNDFAHWDIHGVSPAFVEAKKAPKMRTTILREYIHLDLFLCQNGTPSPKFLFLWTDGYFLGYYNVTKKSPKKPKMIINPKSIYTITLRCYIFRCYVYVADTYLLFLIFLLLN